MVKPPTDAAVWLSSTTCTCPLTASGARDATRAVNCIRPLRKSTLSKPTQSPLEIQPILLPPPSSDVDSDHTTKLGMRHVIQHYGRDVDVKELIIVQKNKTDMILMIQNFE